MDVGDDPTAMSVIYQTILGFSGFWNPWLLGKLTDPQHILFVRSVQQTCLAREEGVYQVFKHKVMSRHTLVLDVSCNYSCKDKHYITAFLYSTLHQAMEYQIAKYVFLQDMRSYVLKKRTYFSLYYIYWSNQQRTSRQLHEYTIKNIHIAFIVGTK